MSRARANKQLEEENIIEHSLDKIIFYLLFSRRAINELIGWILLNLSYRSIDRRDRMDENTVALEK